MSVPAWRHPGVREALEALPQGLEALEVVERLRRTLPPELAREAARQHALRRRAARKLARAERLWLTEKGLEQASDRRVAAARAARIAGAPGAGDAWLLDGTAGIGGDSLALAAAGLARLVSLERDPLTAELLRANLRAVGAAGRVVRGRVETGVVRAAGLLLDPDRRPKGAGGARRGDPSSWEPAWATCLQLLERAASACVKLAPAVDVERLPTPAGRPFAWQWVSLAGELKEVALWTGPWAEATTPRLGLGALARNVLLLGRDGAPRAEWCATPERRTPLPGGVARTVAWIAEPDPAVIRAGLVGALARREGLAPLAAEIAFLGGAHPVRSPLARAYEVLGTAPLDRRRVRRLLRDHDVGPLTVKKRGHPSSAAELAQRFRGPGTNPGVLLVTRLADGHHAYLVRPAAEPPAAGGLR